MSEIRLEDVSRIYPKASTFDRRWGAGPRDLTQGQADQAFAERVAAQSMMAQGARATEGEIKALDHVNLVIPNGQTFAIVGPSGCGKSTLLRVISGLEGDYTGRVLYDGEDVREVPPKDRYIGMVFQNYALYPHFEGHGNLSFFFKVHKAPDAEAEERIRATSEIMGFGFNTLLDRKPGTLSGGQQQRLAIARALVRNPRLFLFDEPLSNLDAKLRTQTRVEIKRLLRRFQITAVYVTHDQEEAIALGDQIAVMREGKVEQVGPFSDLIENPANAFVAGFLGKHPMNLITGPVGDGGVLQTGEVSVPLPRGLAAAFEPGYALTVGIRPEASRLAPAALSEDGINLAGEVEMIEPDFMRHTQMIFMRVAGNLTLRLVGSMDEGVHVGETVNAFLPAGSLYLFDGVTGDRLAR